MKTGLPDVDRYLAAGKARIGELDRMIHDETPPLYHDVLAESVRATLEVRKVKWRKRRTRVGIKSVDRKRQK